MISNPFVAAKYPSESPLLLGCDFSSSPSTKKQIVLVMGHLCGSVLLLSELKFFSTIAAWQQALENLEAWVGGFDLPFGLPRELIQAWGWPDDWKRSIESFASHPRPVLRGRLQAFCDARPSGQKFAHRATDGPAGSSPSMKWVHPPVAWMLHAGMPVLLGLNAYCPAHENAPNIQPKRIALEAYPGLLARSLLGLSKHTRRLRYKQDDPKRQTPAQYDTRQHMLHTLQNGAYPWGLRLSASPEHWTLLLNDAQGDALDAVLCLVQTAWSWQQHAQGHPRWGLPEQIDPLEGWILGA